MIISVYFHIKLFQSGPFFKKATYKYSPTKNNLANSHRNQNLRKVGMNKYDGHMNKYDTHELSVSFCLLPVVICLLHLISLPEMTVWKSDHTKVMYLKQKTDQKRPSRELEDYKLDSLKNKLN